MLIQYTIRSVVLALGLVLSLPAMSAAIFDSVTGDVKAGASASAATAASQGQRIEAGTTIVTGRGGRATLRFDDGKYVLLHEYTEFRISGYTFIKDQPARDNFLFDFLKGAMRMVTAAIKPRSPNAYRIRTPQATIGIRGTDFMLASVNPLYVSVLGGTVTATNTGGTVAFGAGTTGFVANASALAAVVPASSLPASVSTAFGQLGSIAVGAGGAVGATAAATGTITPAAAAIAAGVAAAVAVSISDDDTPAPATATATATR